MVFLFSHYTLRMQKLIDRKNTDCFPLWRERGTIRQDGWWKVEPSMLERRNVDRCDWYIKSMEQHFLSYIPFFNANEASVYRASLARQQTIVLIPPFSPDRSSLMCFPVLIHKLAYKQEDKL